MSKIGIFGGTFNPIHNGHIYIAECVYSKLGLDRLIFVPTGIAPHKNNSDFAPREHRFEMVKISIPDHFDVSDYEIKSNGVCYTVDTMSAFKKLYKNDDLYYIIGGDSLRDFMSWKEPMKLFEMLHIVVVDREGADVNFLADEYRRKYDAKITVCPIKPVNISSTEIRQIAKQKGDLSKLVPKEVENYIYKHRLYTED